MEWEKQMLHLTKNAHRQLQYEKIYFDLSTIQEVWKR